MNWKSTILIWLILSLLVACDEPDDRDTTVTDIDGNIYQTVVIGEQEWMAENLKVTHYRNGDTIPNISIEGDWIGTTSGALCYYDNLIGNVDTCGALYNWYTVDDSRGLAPEGWHIPTDSEWKELEIYLGISPSDADSLNYRGTTEGDLLKSVSGWLNDGNGNNESGFTALPCGYRSSGGSGFGSMGRWAGFPSSSPKDNSYIWGRILFDDSHTIYRAYTGREVGFSVRCIKD
jgi:uncharacterized protein (TIGR02145 family)